MAFQLSPGVNVSEIDLTTIIPVVGVSGGAFVGNFVWGPVNDIVTIDNELQLAERFGKPDINTFTSFFTAANFLSYSNGLKLVRSANTNAKNATSNANGVMINNEIDYRTNYSTGANTYGQWAAKYPSELGNSLKVSTFANTNSTLFNAWTYAGYFDSAPGTSTWASNNGATADEIHVVVIDAEGKFSGVRGQVLERFSNLSKASDAKTDDGSSNYYANVLNDRSKYVWWMAHPDAGTNWGNPAANTTFVQQGATTYTLSGGAHANPTDGNITTSYDLFKNADEVDVSLVMLGAHSTTVGTYVINNIAEYRKDCIAILSPLRTDVVDNLGSEADDIITTRESLPSSSYAVMDSNWKYQFDKYNNVYRWVPLNGDVAGLCARTDLERDPWFSPAGFNRGQIKNVTRLAWNPNKSDRDDLYKSGVNPVLSFQGEGTVLYGDKTLLAKPSAFDRINVRRLFIVLEKAIARAAKYSLFEFNDQFTRAQFVALVEPYLRDVQGRRGIYDFRVVCDETNNTPEVIDRNEFVGDIYIKPARSINFIQLNFVAVRTGVAFEEIVGKF